MHEKIIVSDFDGTITKKDTLTKFLEDYANPRWLDIENDWLDGKLGSKECLTRQFALVPKLTPALVDEFLDTIEIDEWFIPFCDYAKENNIPVVILSDGLDYFINRILERYNIDYINVITNHAYFNEYDKFIIEYPNNSDNCTNNAGTCKCKAIKNLKKLYNTVYYVGDGTSDFCAASKADILFAKSALSLYCKKNGLNFINYKSYKEVLHYVRFGK